MPAFFARCRAAATTPAALLLVMTAGISACDQRGPTDPGDQPVTLGKASSDPVVSSADPAAAGRDTTLDVRVLGSGFDAGSQADFLLDGVPVPGVTTNRTIYRTSRELVANITIAADAVPERYDIRVTTSGGKKGIGTEKFQVVDVVDLGTLGGKGSRSNAVNRFGQVAGNASRADGTGAGFVWSDGVMHELPSPNSGINTGTWDLNDAGVVVGSAYDGVRWLALRWTPSGGAWTLDTLPILSGYEGGSDLPRAINNSGDILGVASKMGLPARVTLWRNGLPYPVNIAAGLDPASLSVWDLSEAGWISGNASIGGLNSAFVWRPDGSGAPGSGITIVLPRHGSGNHWGRAVNESGLVAGYVEGKNGAALRWRPLRPDPLVTSDYAVEALPGSNGVAWDVGDDGFTVGSQNDAAASWSAGGSAALLPVLQGPQGLAKSVQWVDGRHWVAGETVLAGYWRATLWRVP